MVKTTTKKGKTATKRQAKKAAPSTRLPAPKDKEPLLPRGQEMLPNGTIRLKTGTHDLGRTAVTYDVHGMKLSLSGKVLIANQDVDWLSIGACQKCSTERPDGITVHRDKFGAVALTFKCANKKECDLAELLYVQVHSKGRFNFA